MWELEDPQDPLDLLDHPALRENQERTESLEPTVSVERRERLVFKDTVEFLVSKVTQVNLEVLEQRVTEEPLDKRAQLERAELMVLLATEETSDCRAPRVQEAGTVPLVPRVTRDGVDIRDSVEFQVRLAWLVIKEMTDLQESKDIWDPKDQPEDLDLMDQLEMLGLLAMQEWTAQLDQEEDRVTMDTLDLLAHQDHPVHQDSLEANLVQADSCTHRLEHWRRDQDTDTTSNITNRGTTEVLMVKNRTPRTTFQRRTIMESSSL